MATETAPTAPRARVRFRDEERVMPLELLFDLVFVLAITQCTTLMADNPTWSGLAQGVAVLTLLWWCWASFAWLTALLDPEEGGVRIAIFGAMAAMLIVALCVPAAFGELALEFAIGYGAVRAAHIALFIVASRDDPNLRRSILQLSISSSIAIVLLVAASLFDGATQGGIWVAAVLLDTVGPLMIGSGGWQLPHPTHFAERHGLIIIIALGESIVAIGVGAELGMTAGIAAAAVLGTALIAALWWIYFDVVALVAARRLAEAPEGAERNALARDSYTYMHLVMVAGIVLVALGLKKTIGDVEDPLEIVPAFALLGGVAFYLLGHVGSRYRHMRTINRQRLGLALLLFALLPAAIELPALAVLAVVTGLLCALIVYETRLYGESRDRVRHEGLFPSAAS